MKSQDRLKWPSTWSSSLSAKTLSSTAFTDFSIVNHSTRCATNNITNLLSTSPLLLRVTTLLSIFCAEILLGLLGHYFLEARLMFGQLVYGEFWDICNLMKDTVGMSFHGACGELFHSNLMLLIMIIIILLMLVTSRAPWLSGIQSSTPMSITIKEMSLRKTRILKIKRKLNE